MSNNATTVRSTNPVTVFMTNKLIVFVMRIVLAAVFIYSSLDKVAHPEGFAIAVRGYQFLPLEMTNIFAIVIAWAELVAGVLLLLGLFTRKAAAAALLLLAMFTGAVGIALGRGIAIDCGCFSNEGGHTTDYTLIIRNLFLITAAAIVVRFDGGFLSIDGILRKRKSG